MGRIQKPVVRSFNDPRNPNRRSWDKTIYPCEACIFTNKDSVWDKNDTIANIIRGGKDEYKENKQGFWGKIKLFCCGKSQMAESDDEKKKFEPIREDPDNWANKCRRRLTGQEIIHRRATKPISPGLIRLTEEILASAAHL